MIDYELIWKKIHHRLTPEEEEQFQMWINSDEKHPNYFNKIRAFYLNKPNKAPRLYKKKVTRQILVYGTSVAAAIALLLVVFLRNDDLEPKDTATLDQSPALNQENQINYGSSKAILTIENGETYYLSKESAFSKVVDDVRISSSGESLSYSQREAENPATEELKYCTLKVPRGGEYFILLSDSTKVWINSESELRYPVRFAGEQRKVELTGEAYFEVATDPDRPFQVIASGQLVEVLGTKFNISGYKEDPIIYTTLLEGKVQVSSQEENGESILLLPNTQGMFNRLNQEISKREVDPSSFIAWTEGRFVFQNQRMDSIMLVLQRWYDIDVEFLDESLEGLCFTGNIKRYTNFEQILDLLQYTNEMNYEITGRTVKLNQ